MSNESMGYFDNNITHTKTKATVFRLLLLKFQFDKSELVVVNKADVMLK